MSNPKRIYIAGPMTGLPDHNFPAFYEAAKRLQEAGWETVNPAENFDGRTDLPLLAQCNAVAMLPGWEDSRGAKLEYLNAWELGMEVLDAETFAPITSPVPGVHLHRLAVVRDEQPEAPESLLDEANRITTSDRQDDYGHPSQDFARTALLWTGILAGRLREGQFVSPMDVPLCMIAVKLARQAHRHKRDNLVDIAGYARTAAMVAGDE